MEPFPLDKDVQYYTPYAIYAQENNRYPNTRETGKNNYLTFLTASLFDMVKQKELCDITIVVGETRFAAHKAVLSIVSPYFKTMFTSAFLEARSSEVTIDGDSNAFRYLLEFAYTGRLGLTPHTVADILSLACYMQCDKAVGVCEKYIEETFAKNGLYFQEAWDLVLLAELHGLLPNFKKAVKMHMKRNFEGFAKTSLFLEPHMTRFVLDCFRNADAMRKIDDDEQVLDIMLRWMKHNWDQRKEHAAELLKQIPLGLLPLNRLQQLRKDIPGCKKPLDEAIKIVKAKKKVDSVTAAKKYPLLCKPRTLVKALLRTGQYGVYQYNNCSNEWTRLTTMGQLTMQHRRIIYNQLTTTLVVIQDELYAVGGSVIVNGRCCKSNGLSKYNPFTNKWDALASMNRRRGWKCTVVHLDGYIYAIGGDGDGDEGGETSMERYNVAKGKWSKGELIALDLMDSKQTYPTVAFNGCIFMYGKEGLDDVLRAYIPATNEWAILPMPPHQHGDSKDNPPTLMVHNDKCYLVVYRRVDSHKPVESHYGDGDPHYVGDRDPPQVRPHVHQLEIIFDETSVPTLTPVTLGEAQPQDLIPANHCGAFLIDNDIFVNSNGHVHNTGIKAAAAEGQEECVNLDDWDRLNLRKDGYSSESLRGISVVYCTLDLEKVK